MREIKIEKCLYISKKCDIIKDVMKEREVKCSAGISGRICAFFDGKAD